MLDEARPFVFYSFTVEFYSLCFEIFYSETVENLWNVKYSTVSFRNCRKHSEAVDRTTFYWEFEDGLRNEIAKYEFRGDSFGKL